MNLRLQLGVHGNGHREEQPAVISEAEPARSAMAGRVFRVLVDDRLSVISARVASDPE